MKNKLRWVYLLLSSVFISLLHLPLALAKSASGNRFVLDPEKTAPKIPAPLPSPMPFVRSVYDSLHLGLSGLSHQAFEYAKKGLDILLEQGKLLNDSVIAIIDFSLPSNMKRLYILDLHNYKVLFNTLVAHGKNSGREMANSFSNQFASYKSSTGFFITGETYNGNNGYSLKLNGLERGVNDNAYERGIVLHGAHYVSPSYVAAQGYIGRSEGCPAVPENMSGPIIDEIKEGTCLFIYHPSYVHRSTVLK